MHVHDASLIASQFSVLKELQMINKKRVLWSSRPCALANRLESRVFRETLYFT